MGKHKHSVKKFNKLLVDKGYPKNALFSMSGYYHKKVYVVFTNAIDITSKRHFTGAEMAELIGKLPDYTGKTVTIDLKNDPYWRNILSF